MLTLNFEGFFQCRLATDPDPADEPRGVSGWTFAVAGEDDLDRIIRLQEPAFHRSHGPKIGVFVSSVSVGEQSIVDHPLDGARVDLLDKPKFEGRNGILSEAMREFMDPFHLQIRGGDVILQRRDVWDPTNEEVKIYEATPSMLKRRQPVEDEVVESAEIADATGIMNYPEHLQERKNKLEEELAETSEPVMRVALRKRIDDLKESLDNEEDRRRYTLGAALRYRFDIGGPASPGKVIDETNVLGGTVGTSPPWPIEFWMGGWDADALCGYMCGSLRVPFRSR